MLIIYFGSLVYTDCSLRWQKHLNLVLTTRCKVLFRESQLDCWTNTIVVGLYTDILLIKRENYANVNNIDAHFIMYHSSMRIAEGVL